MSRISRLLFHTSQDRLEKASPEPRMLAWTENDWGIRAAFSHYLMTGMLALRGSEDAVSLAAAPG
jgi:hypothetical protein